MRCDRCDIAAQWPCECILRGGDGRLIVYVCMYMATFGIVTRLSVEMHDITAREHGSLGFSNSSCALYLVAPLL